MSRNDEYRLQVRKTFQQFSDQALAFQDARIVGGIDREECDREILRRQTQRLLDNPPTVDSVPQGYVGER